MRLCGILLVFLCAMVYANDEQERLAERKRAIVSCANAHLESCEKLLSWGVPSVQACDVRTECEFAGWLYAQVQNYVQSLPYLKKACDHNHKDGCDKLGFSYQRLNNHKNAKKYYKIACDKGSMSGCYNLAMLYYDGLGVRHSYEMANTLFQKICDHNEGIGCLQLGVSYAKGYGVGQNHENARTYFEKGCALGNNESCNFLDLYQQDEVRNESVDDEFVDHETMEDLLPLEMR